jgi:hypothetical protein
MNVQNLLNPPPLLLPRPLLGDQCFAARPPLPLVLALRLDEMLDVRAEAGVGGYEVHDVFERGGPGCYP